MGGATEAEATQKDEAAADGTKQEDTTLVGTAKAGASPADEAGAKRAIGESAEEPAQTPVKEQKVAKEAAGEPRTTRVTVTKAVC